MTPNDFFHFYKYSFANLYPNNVYPFLDHLGLAQIFLIRLLSYLKFYTYVKNIHDCLFHQLIELPV